MSDKATLLREADLAFGELRGAIDGLTDEDMRRVWLGTWGVREILIHISGWHDEVAAALGRVAKGMRRTPRGRTMTSMPGMRGSSTRRRA